MRDIAPFIIVVVAIIGYFMLLYWVLSEGSVTCVS